MLPLTICRKLWKKLKRDILQLLNSVPSRLVSKAAEDLFSSSCHSLEAHQVTNWQRCEPINQEVNGDARGFVRLIR